MVMAEELVGSARHGMTEVYAVVTPKTHCEQKNEQIINVKLHRGITRKMTKMSSTSTAKNTLTNNRGSIYKKQATLPGHMSRQTSESSQRGATFFNHGNNFTSTKNFGRIKDSIVEQPETSGKNTKTRSLKSLKDRRMTISPTMGETRRDHETERAVRNPLL